MLAWQKRADRAQMMCSFWQLLLLRDFSSEHVSDSHDSLTRVIDFINRSYATQMTLDDICRAVYISKYYLCRRFKAAVGMTVMEYLLKTRIAAAQNRLVAEESAIGQIAEQCGFSGISYFSQSFKKHTGMTPLQYRRRMRCNGKE